MNEQIVRYTADLNEGSASLLCRLAVSAKNCVYSCIRISRELWLFAVRLICSAGLFFALFGPKNVGKCVRWMREGLTDINKLQIARNNQRFKREQWNVNPKGYIIGVGLVILFSCIFGFLVNTKDFNVREQYLVCAGETIDAYAVDISNMLLDIKNTNTLTEEDRQKLYMLIDAQIKVDQLILNYDISGELEEYADLHAGICGLCENDMRAIQSIRESIENDLIPSAELLQNYTNIRGKNYLWTIERLAEELTSLSMELGFDL